MSKLYLVRHGQASFGKSNYDQLSDLGAQQAKWLGEYFRDAQHPGAQMIEGSMNRHRQTTDNLGVGFPKFVSRQVDNAWDEFDFETLLKLYLTQHPEDMPSTPSPKVFFGILRKAMHQWSSGALQSEHIEPWESFTGRVEQGLQAAHALAKDHPVIVVTSGGAIAVVMKTILGLDIDRMIDINMQTRNTSLTELYCGNAKTHLVSFNSTPHLEAIDRREFITSV